MTLHTQARTSGRRLAVGAATALALAGCSSSPTDDTDGTAVPTVTMADPDGLDPGFADRDDTSTGASPTAGDHAQANGSAQPTKARSVCETVPAVIDEDTILSWLDTRDGDDIRGVECEELDPEIHAGVMSRYWFLIGYPEDWVDPEPLSSTSLNVIVTDREAAERWHSEMSDGGDYMGSEWGPERDVAVLEAERLEFTDTAGRTFDATGSQLGVAVFTDAHKVEFALPQQHPNFGRSIDPVVVDGEVNPLYAEAFGDLLVATLVE